MDEPEDLVAHHVVGQPVGLGVEGEEADPEAVGLDHARCAAAVAVAVGHGGGDPGGVGPATSGPMPDTSPPAPRRLVERAVGRRGRTTPGLGWTR